MTLKLDTANQLWKGRSPRERSLLALLAAISFGLVSWYGIASPLSRAAASSDMHRSRAAALLREVEDSRAIMTRMAIPTDKSLGDLLMLSALEAGFTLDQHSEANAGETAVRGRASDSAALFAWIDMLRKNHGLTVSNLTAEREKDGGLRVEASFMWGDS